MDYKRRLKYFLAKAEEYTGIDLNYFGSGAFWLLSSQILISLIAFFSNVLLAKFLSYEVFGEYRFYISLILLSLLFALPGMQSALMQSDPKKYPDNLNLAKKEMQKYALLGTMLFSFLSFYLFWEKKIIAATVTLMIAVSIPFFNPGFIYTFFLKALGKFKEAVTFQVLLKFISSALVIFLAFTNPSNILLLILAYLLSQIILNEIFFKITKKKYLKKNEISKTDPALSEYALKLSFMIIPGIIVANLDKVIVKLVLGSTAVAIFTIASIIIQEITRLLQQVSYQLLLPKFSAEQEQDNALLSKVLRVSKFYIFFISFIIIIYYYLSPVFINLFFPKYSAAIPYSQLFALSLFYIAAIPARAFFVARKLQRELYIISFALPLLSIILFLILSFKFEMLGAIVAVILYSFIYLISSLLLLLNLKKSPKKDITERES